MTTAKAIDWDAIIRDPRFQNLHRRKTTFLWGLMALSVVYFLLLPIGAAYYPELFKIPVWGVVNFGLLFALSQFVVIFVIAVLYSRKASQDFDSVAAQIVADFTDGTSVQSAGAIPSTAAVAVKGAQP